jgi:hypothetical protein
MHSPDRYIFALAMLEGDRAARQVLADMLEEQGERGLAQWAREGRRDKRRTLEFGVMLLSCRPAIGLAAEFIGKLFDSADRLVVAAQLWASKRMDDTEAIEACRREVADLRLQRSRSYYRTGGYLQYYAADCAELLVTAMQRAIESEHFARSEDVVRTAARGLESRNYVRQIVQQTSRLSPRMAAEGEMRYQSNYGWQTEQLQQLLKELLAAEADKWPR